MEVNKPSDILQEVEAFQTSSLYTYTQKIQFSVLLKQEESSKKKEYSKQKTNKNLGTTVTFQHFHSSLLKTQNTINIIAYMCVFCFVRFFFTLLQYNKNHKKIHSPKKKKKKCRLYHLYTAKFKDFCPFILFKIYPLLKLFTYYILWIMMPHAKEW